MGSVLTPALVGLAEAAALPEASSFCGRCEEVCPMRIPLPALLRHHREAAFAGGHGGMRARLALRVWGALARQPWLYRAVTGLAARLLAAFAGRRGRFRRLPLATGWTRHRDLPAPEGATFQQLWSRQGGER